MTPEVKRAIDWILSHNTGTMADVPWVRMGSIVSRYAEHAEKEIERAISLAVKYGGIDGDHHKAWVIDQMVRALAGDRYEKIVADACNGDDGPDSFSWDCGIAP